MPSPNGYITSETVDRIDRSWARGTLHYDASQAPWTDPNLGGYQFEMFVGQSATGPFNPAPLTSPGTQCNTVTGNRIGLGGLTETTFGVGGAGGVQPPQADTDYWVRIVVRDPQNVAVDDYVVGPYHTAPYPNAVCLAPTNVTQTSAEVHMASDNGGRFNITAPCNQDGITWELATTPTGPWTTYPRQQASDFTPDQQFAGLTPNTQYYYRVIYDEVPGIGNGGVYLTSEPCTFRTLEATVTTPPSFDPQPCCGTGSGGPDVENVILCELDAQGNLLGTALAVYEYDSSGNPVGAPTFIDPVTGDPYTLHAGGTLQVCPEGTCMPPMQFCQTATSTGPVDHPGRVYDVTLPINPGFAVDRLQIDSAANAAGITWSIFDTDGSKFAADLKAFTESRIPGSTVTVTNPNAGSTQVCGAALPMQIHIECLRLDQSPPNLIEYVYNAGNDLIQNPAYNESPPLNPPAPQGNYGFRLLSRQDDPGPFPGNPPANDALCTSVANRGWETNDVGRTFEIWGKDVATSQNTTPTPRGTPVQEMTSDGPPPGGRSTIWQTFNVTSPGTFNIRVVHGARDAGENHIISLSTGDTDANQVGDILIDNSTPPSVTSSGGPNPWTVYNNTASLNSGLYTLALSTNNPAGGARGGLFTDMRVYIDRPNTRATATHDDTTCVVTTEETQTTDTCSFWQPQCVGGVVAGWENVETGMRLSNGEFWAQVPTPKCCTASPAAAEGGNGVKSNMAISDLVCATVGGIRQTVIRAAISDPSGGLLQQLFIADDGTPITPDSWTPGTCTTEAFVTEQIVCELEILPGGGVNVNPIREATSWTVDVNENPRAIGVRHFQLGSTVPYTPTGTVGMCDFDSETQWLCDVQPGGQVVPFQRAWLYNNEGLTIAAHDTNGNGVPYTVTGSVTDCAAAFQPIAVTGLCLADGTPIGIVNRRNSLSGVMSQDGWINLLTGAFTVGAPPAGAQACGQNLNIQTSDVLCDMNTSTGVVNKLVLIQYNYNPDGSIASTQVLDATTGAPYTPVGTITVCPTDTAVPDNDQQVLCDRQADGTLVPFLRDYRRDAVGQISGFTDYTLGGAAYTVTGTVQSCIPRDVESVILCDSAAVPNRFVRTYTYSQTGAISGFTDSTLAGAAFTPTGAVGICSPTQGRDEELQVLCSTSGATVTRFLRRYNYDQSTGSLIGIVDTTLDGSTPFTPATVGVCTTAVQSDTDFVEEVMSDSTGTCFLRLFRFDSTTGNLISTTNTTLAGAAYTPSGTVTAGCPICCPSVLASGCTNTGSGRYTSIRNANGTISLIDSVTGAAITQANIIACADDNVVRVLTAQHQLAVPGSPWTPPGGQVITSLTYTVLTGTATVVDGDGTSVATLPAGLSATWNAEDDNSILPPQSITSVGGQVYVHWTAR